MIWIIQATFVFTLIYGHLSSLTFPLQELQLGYDVAAIQDRMSG